MPIGGARDSRLGARARSRRDAGEWNSAGGYPQENKFTKNFPYFLTICNHLHRFFDADIEISIEWGEFMKHRLYTDAGSLTEAGRLISQDVRLRLADLVKVNLAQHFCGMDLESVIQHEVAMLCSELRVRQALAERAPKDQK